MPGNLGQRAHTPRVSTARSTTKQAWAGIHCTTPMDLANVPLTYRPLTHT
jgi:hypothetical protein